MTEIRAGWQVVLPLSDKNTMILPWFGYGLGLSVI
jgi:hypothetical protein